MNPANVVSFTAANHTPGGIKVVRLNQNYSVGPSKSLKVYAGDKVDLEAWTYYEQNSGFGTSSPAAATLITAIAGAFGGVSGAGGESGSIFSGVNSGLTGYGLGGNAGDTAPAAYLNYILFDQGYKVITMGWTRVPASAYFAKQKISITDLNVKEAGYIFVYLSYEDLSNNYVEFDDFKITHTKSNLIQANEYYPFGLQTANSWTRENTTGNNFLGNGGTELNPTSNLYDLEYRNYDPALGRMNQVDPMAGKYASHSPYSFSFNDPVYWNDPSGADPWYDNLSPFLKRNTGSGKIQDTGTFGGGGGGYGGSIINPGFSDEAWNQIGGTVNTLWNNTGANGIGTWMPGEGMHYYNEHGVEVNGNYGGGYGGGGRNEGGMSVGVTLSMIANSIANGNGWNYTMFGSFGAYSAMAAQTYGVTVLREVSVLETRLYSGWLQDRIDETFTNPYNNSSFLYAGVSGISAVVSLGIDIAKNEIRTGAVYSIKAGVAGVKLLGRGVMGLSIVASGTQLFFAKNRKPSDYARFGGSIAITATAAIPAVGPYVSFGLGSADALGAFEGFYQSFNIPVVRDAYLDLLLHLPK